MTITFFLPGADPLDSWPMSSPPRIGETVRIDETEYRVGSVRYVSPRIGEVECDVGLSEIADLSQLTPVPDDSRPLLK